MAAQKIARQVRTRSVSRRVPKHASDRLKRHRPLLIGRYGLTRRQQSELLRHRGEAKYDGQTLEQNLRGFAGSPQYNALQTDEARWEAIQKRIAIYDRIACMFNPGQRGKVGGPRRPSDRIV